MNLHLPPASALKRAFGILACTSALLLSQNYAQAQCLTTFSVSSASYVALSTGTGATQLIGTGANNVASGVTNIGFTFFFNGIAYTQFSTTENGVIGLGSTQLQDNGGENNINSPAANVNYPHIAPFWDELTTGGNGSVLYQLKGNSPTRTLVIQFRNQSTSGNPTSYQYDYQVILYEGSNCIEFHYNLMSAVGSTASIGMAVSGDDFMAVQPMKSCASLPATVSCTDKNSNVNLDNDGPCNNENKRDIPSGTIFRFCPNDRRLPVELSWFNLTSSNGRVALAWRTASEIDNAGFEVRRAPAGSSDFKAITSYLTNPGLVGLGTNTEGRNYLVVDGEDGALEVGSVYQYQLVDITSDGIRTSHTPQQIMVRGGDEGAVGGYRFAVKGVYPSPVTSDRFELSLDLMDNSLVTVELYSTEGRLVSTPVSGAPLSAGPNSLFIDASRLVTGKYLIKVAAGEQMRMHEVTIVR